MKAKFCILLLVVFLISCDEDKTENLDVNCGKEVTTLCYAHNWAEFSMLSNFHDGNAVYNYNFISKDNTFQYYYKAKLDVVCNTSNIKVDFTNTVKQGSNVTYLADVIFNGVAESVTLNNINGVITGTFNKKINFNIPITVEIISLIVLSANPLPNDATIWFNENVQSFGYTATYQVPK